VPGAQLLQRAPVRRERDEARQATEREVARVDGIVAGPQPSSGALGGVEDEHRPHPRVVESGIDAEQTGHARPEAGLLEQLAHRALLGRLPVFHEPGRQAPRAGAGIELAADQQHAGSTGQDHARRWDRVAVGDVTALRTGGPGPSVLVAHHQAGAAARTESGVEQGHEPGSVVDPASRSHPSRRGRSAPATSTNKKARPRGRAFKRGWEHRAAPSRPEEGSGRTSRPGLADESVDAPHSRRRRQ